MDEHDGEAGSSRLVLIRHGEGKVNVDGIIGASRVVADSPISGAGRFRH
jgi:hypothetical protein